MKNLQALSQNTYDSGVYLIDFQTDVSEISNLAEKREFKYLYINGKEITTKQDFFDKAKEIVACPYFGNNWDALLDCMRDMSWYSAEGYILVYDDTEFFAHNDPKEFHTAVEVLKDATEFWRITMNNKPPMYILLRGDIEGIPVLGES